MREPGWSRGENYKSQQGRRRFPWTLLFWRGRMVEGWKMAASGVSGGSGGDSRLVSLPLSRIRVIMKSSPEVSSINPDAIFLTAKATVGAEGDRGDSERLLFAPIRFDRGPAACLHNGRERAAPKYSISVVASLPPHLSG